MKLNKWPPWVPQHLFHQRCGLCYTDVVKTSDRLPEFLGLLMFPPDKIDLICLSSFFVCAWGWHSRSFSSHDSNTCRSGGLIWVRVNVCVWAPRCLSERTPAGINSMTLKMIKWVMKMNACFRVVLNGYIIWLIFLLIDHTLNVTQGYHLWSTVNTIIGRKQLLCVCERERGDSCEDMSRQEMKGNELAPINMITPHIVVRAAASLQLRTQLQK